jgi:hypothetical protein
MAHRLAVRVATLGLLVLGCAEKPTVSGAPEQWVRGKKFSIQVSFSGQAMQLRNDSTGETGYSPLLLVGQYRDAGKRMKLLTSGSSKVKPGEQFSVPLGSQLGAAAQDAMSELRVEIGDGAEKEIFLVR